MIRSRKCKTMLAVIAILMLAACGNSEKSAQSDIQKARTAWQAETGDLNPTQRLAAYNRIIDAVEKVGKNYPDTTYGKAILANHSIDGVSLSAMQRIRDRLAPRAECYANPTVDCLRPFSSRPSGAGAAGKGRLSGDPRFRAQQLVCSKGFAAAEHALDDLRINKPAYTGSLIQVALAAAKCDKPSEVKAATDAYLATIPTQGDSRIRARLGILATADLRPAWPAIMQQLENDLKAPGLAKNEAAGIAATLTVAYAKIGNSRSALVKYRYLTETLNYRLSPDARQTLRTQLILGGDADEGLKHVDVPSNPYSSVVALSQAATAAGTQLKLTNSTGLPSISSLNAANAPLSATEKAYYATAAGSIEAALDGWHRRPGARRSRCRESI